MKINAVFEGGGMKAIALVGGVKATEERGFQFRRVAGTSSGAIVASFIAAGYSAEEMKEMIAEKPFTRFAKTWTGHLRVIGPAVRLWWKKGLYSANPLEQWVEEKLTAKGVRTFADLTPNQLRIIASDISRGRMIVIPDDLENYGIEPGRFPVARAVRMSASLPFFFDPVILRLNGNDVSYIVDGGLLSNFPLWLFDRETENEGIPTIGFQLVGPKKNGRNEIRGPLSMLQALFSTMVEAHDERYIEKHNRFRTVMIPTMGVRTTEFDLSEKKCGLLYQSGLESTRNFYNGWSFAEYMKQFDKYVACSKNVR